MNKLCIYPKADGGICITELREEVYCIFFENGTSDFKTYPFDGSRLATANELILHEKSHFEKFAGQSLSIEDFHIIDPEDVKDFYNFGSDKNEEPKYRFARGALIHTSGVVSVDMPMAKEIHKENLRRERIPLLVALDVAYIIADEKGDTDAKIDIATQKKTLRDITEHPEIEAAMTLEELKTAAISVLAESPIADTA